MIDKPAIAAALAIATLVLAAPARSQQSLAPPARLPPNLTFTPVSVDRPSAGRFERVTVHGSSLSGNLEGDSPDRMVSVYLPPSYAKDPQRRYPVVYILHGFTDSDSRWFGLEGPTFVDLPTAVDRAYAHGAREMILVMPNAYTKYAGSMYSSSVVTGDWDAFLTHDLVRYIDAHYRTLPRAASRGLAGHSMGGYGTLRIAMKYPHVFSSIYALSPCCLGANLDPNPAVMARAAQVLESGDLAKADFGTKAMLASAAAWSPDPSHPPAYFDLPIENGKPVPAVIAAWAANAPLAMVYQSIASLKTYRAIAFDAGDRDVGINQTVRTLDQILTRFGVRHEATIYGGNHVDHIQERLEMKLVPFFSTHLSFK